MMENVAPGPDSPILRVALIGSLTVERGAVTLDGSALGGPKPRQILEILLLNLGIPVSKHRLIDLLWGANPPREALTSIESYVSVLRRRLQPGHGRSGPLRTTTGGYVLDPGQVDLDLSRFEGLLRQARGRDAAESYPLLVEALALATGPLLGDELRPAWAEEERHRHSVDVTVARVLAAEAAHEIRRFDEAARWAREAVTADPLNERAWTALVLGLESAGRPAEGLRAYAECRDVLDRALGCEPSAMLRGVHRRLLLATASSGGDLSEAVSALLVLHDRLQRKAGADADAALQLDGPMDVVRQAAQVLRSLLRRVPEAA